MLHEAIDILEARFEEIKSKKSYLSKRQSTIFEYIKVNEPVKISDISERFPMDKIHTIRKDILYLKNENLIKQVGKARATVYYFKNSV